MKTIFQTAWKNLCKKKTYTLLLLAACMVAMNTVVSSITNATADRYQQKILERNIGLELENVLHLNYTQSFETQEFANLVPEYLQYISDLDGVESVGQFDVTGTYFEELRGMENYTAANAKIQAGGIYEKTPDIARVLYADESILRLVKTGIAQYTKPKSGNLPLIASDAFKEILPLGTVLTEERTKTRYEVTGYLPIGKQWVDENDLIRFPLVSMDGWFIAPFSPRDKTDLMTQLSCLQNTYIMLSKNADTNSLKAAIEEYSLSHGFHAAANDLQNEYNAYQKETKAYAAKQTALAVLLSMMAVSSIAAVFTTNVILQKGKYGVYLANGYNQKEMTQSILIQIMLLIFPATVFVWIGMLFHLMYSKDLGIVLFRRVLLTAHFEYTLLVCMVIAVVVGIIASLIPAVKLSRYQPCELIGGHQDGTD